MATVYNIIAAYKRALLKRETAAVKLMADRWAIAQRRMSGELGRLTREIAAKQAAGEEITAGLLRRQERYRTLLAQAATEHAKYADDATKVIKSATRAGAKMGVDSAAAALNEMGVSITFDQVNIGAIEAMAGVLDDGSPVHDALMERFPDAWESFENELIASTAQGKSPVIIARRAAEKFGVTVANAMRIARTEMQRAFREASRETYRASGVVQKYKRVAAHDSRTCVACLALDGKVYKTSEPLSDHPNGRCAMVPIVDGMPEVKWESGEDWFNRQDEDIQRDMLGPKRYKAFKDNQFDFERLAQIQSEPTWGKQVRVRPLRGLL